MPAEQLALRDEVLALHELDEAVVFVGLPVEVGGKLGKAAEALLALAQRRLGALAAQELAELASDDAGSLEQARVRLAQAEAPEDEHAEPPPGARRREGEGAVQAAAPGERRGEHARVVAGIDGPDRLAGLEDGARESLAGSKRHGAAGLDEALDLRIGLGPRRLELQPRRALVEAEIAAAGPAFALADCAQHRSQPLDGVLGVRERTGHLVLEAQELLRALLRGDLPAHAPVADEPAVCRVHRLAAHAKIARAAVALRAPHQHVVVGQAGGEELAVGVPAAFDVQAGLPPARADQPRAQLRIAAGHAAAFQPREAELGVLLPVPVRGEIGEAAKARLALAQRAHRSPVFPSLAALTASFRHYDLPNPM